MTQYCFNVFVFDWIRNNRKKNSAERKYTKEKGMKKREYEGRSTKKNNNNNNDN